MRNKISVLYRILFLGMLLSACQSQETNPNKDIVSEFYHVYNERQDFERFLGFYAEEAVLQDIMTGDKIEGKPALRDFFDWTNPDFKSLEENTIVVSEILVDNNKVVVSGHYSRFQWGNSEFEAMHFTTLLTLNKVGKIIKHVDWINYPATLVDYEHRKNSNDWIKK
nr:nuclear transport factor 2 family protein [Allomuricauda sp.]